MIEEGIHPTVFTYSILINGLCTQGYMEEAIKLLDQMIENNVDPNYVTYWTLIQGYVRCGNMIEISKIYDKMHIHGLLPTNVSGDVKQSCPAIHNPNRETCQMKMHSQC
ncbi:Putative pentatricopeptide repeat-containing protein [Zea mays]|nr:Putative pentatricopeptide repeat-containing protein [Zea mays]